MAVEQMGSVLGHHVSVQTAVLESQLGVLAAMHETLRTPAKTRSAERLADAAVLLRTGRLERAQALAEEAIGLGGLLGRARGSEIHRAVVLDEIEQDLAPLQQNEVALSERGEQLEAVQPRLLEAQERIEPLRVGELQAGAQSRCSRCRRAPSTWRGTSRASRSHPPPARTVGQPIRASAHQPGGSRRGP